MTEIQEVRGNPPPPVLIYVERGRMLEEYEFEEILEKLRESGYSNINGSRNILSDFADYQEQLVFDEFEDENGEYHITIEYIKIISGDKTYYLIRNVTMRSRSLDKILDEIDENDKRIELKTSTYLDIDYKAVIEIGFGERYYKLVGLPTWAIVQVEDTIKNLGYVQCSVYQDGTEEYYLGECPGESDNEDN